MCGINFFAEVRLPKGKEVVEASRSLNLYSCLVTIFWLVMKSVLQLMQVVRKTVLQVGSVYIRFGPNSDSERSLQLILLK